LLVLAAYKNETTENSNSIKTLKIILFFEILNVMLYIMLEIDRRVPFTKHLQL